MAENLIFRGARVRYCDIRREDEAGVFTRIHLASDFSDPVREYFGWPEMPEGISQAKLIGSLTAKHLILTPNSKELEQHEVQMECTEVGDFALYTTKDDEGEVSGEEIRFIARTIQAGASALMENYLRTIGGGMGRLKIGYVEQGKLELAEEAKPEPETEQYSAPPRIETSAESNSELIVPEPDPEPDAPLPSVVQMAGGMDGLKKQRKRREAKAKPEPVPESEVENPTTILEARPLTVEPAASVYEPVPGVRTYAKEGKGFSATLRLEECPEGTTFRLILNTPEEPIQKTHLGLIPGAKLSTATAIVAGKIEDMARKTGNSTDIPGARRAWASILNWALNLGVPKAGGPRPESSIEVLQGGGAQ